MRSFRCWVATAWLLPLGAQAPVAALVGTVLSPEGHPVRGATVVVSHCEGRGFPWVGAAQPEAWREVAHARTDERGRSGVQMPIGLDARVEVDHEAYARWRDETVMPGAAAGNDRAAYGELVMRLRAPCSLQGRLVERATGSGTPGTVTAWAAGSGVELFRLRTGNDGRFAVDRVDAGPFQLWVDPDVTALPRAMVAGVVGAGTSHELVVELESGVTLTGSVTDAETLKPIAGAVVGEAGRQPVRTDVEGVYTLRGCTPGPHPNLWCTSPGYARGHGEHYAAGDRSRVSFALMRGAAVVGRIVDRAGNGVPNARVVVIVSRAGTAWPALEPVRSAADGSFVCDGFPRDADGALMVRSLGHASGTWFLPRPTRDGRVDAGTIVLAAPRLVRGSALDGDGKPIPGAHVLLRGLNADACRLAAEPPGGGALRVHGAARTARVGSDGTFAFGDVAEGTYEACILTGTAAGPSQRIDVAAAVDPPIVRLVR
jgi:hypothetical protein